jgi:ABC-2 type transport system ATP-binding protein
VKRLALVAALGIIAPVTVAGLVAGSPASAAPAYTVQTLHFLVHTGATGATPCDVVGDLYTPTVASATNRVPALLTTNGFGGSKADQAGLGAAFATRGYEVLSYSGLGFGGSGCKITLDDPDTDGKAASQLVSYLGGDAGIAFTDAAHTAAAPALDVVRRDPTDHAGQARTDDPRVGMIGGSYGGEVQFAAASIDPRIDTIIPMITWNDLSYSLGPNNTDLTSGVTSPTPGALKLNWGLGFTISGVESGLTNLLGDPTRIIPCPNFVTFVCPALVTAGSTGFFQPADVAALRHASVTSYMGKIKIPVLLMQGENDTLFNLNEAAANYQALKAQGTPVKMVWQSWGHSGSTPAPGELNLSSPDPSTQYETGRIVDWFDHYLKDSAVSTGPDFSYFRDWVGYTGNAAPAYATSSTFPVGAPQTWYLSGAGDLASTTAGVKAGSQSFLTPPAGAPTSIDPGDALGTFVKGFETLPEKDVPGTFASWKSPVLTTAVNVAGSPSLTVQVSAPTVGLTQLLGPLGQLVLFAKVVDIAPDGTASLVKGQIAPIRVRDVTKPIKVTLPAIVHQFGVGHRLGLVLSGGSLNYRGGVVPALVSIVSGSAQTLVLPVVP